MIACRQDDKHCVNLSDISRQIVTGIESIDEL